jgi:hypothetical protein
MKKEMPRILDSFLGSSKCIFSQFEDSVIDMHLRLVSLGGVGRRNNPWLLLGRGSCAHHMEIQKHFSLCSRLFLELPDFSYTNLLSVDGQNSMVN